MRRYVKLGTSGGVVSRQSQFQQREDHEQGTHAYNVKDSRLDDGLVLTALICLVSAASKTLFDVPE